MDDGAIQTHLLTMLGPGNFRSWIHTYTVPNRDVCDGWVNNTANVTADNEACGGVVRAGPVSVTIPIQPSGNISGMKFNDLEGDGVKNLNDPPLSGWKINLYNADTGTFINSTTTDANGNYRFQDLPCGNYTVNETQQTGWTQTAPPGGKYTVQINGTSLTVIDRDFGNRQEVIKCACPTRAYFSYSPTRPVKGQSIQFTDKATGYPVEWLWTFGDGQSSALKNPTHTYTAAGSYTVTEWVRACGCTGKVYWTSYTRTITVR